MAGSGAATDPLFWVAHGAVERLFQRTVFEGVMTDMSYTSSSPCSGHSYNGKRESTGFDGIMTRMSCNSRTIGMT